MSTVPAPKTAAAPPTEPWVALLFVPEEFAWADGLHWALEGVATDPELVGEPTQHGFPRPRCISVFPDPRDPEAVAQCDAVLPLAKFLVVICSPHSAENPRIEQQIKAFKRGGGEERIIVLVVESERDEHDLAATGRTDKDWLPAWLRWRLDESGNFRPAVEPGEPIILDARPHRLGLEQARADLLAILLDLPLPVAPTPAFDSKSASPLHRRPLALAAGLAVALLPLGGWVLWSKNQPAAPAVARIPATPPLPGPFALEVSDQSLAEPNVSLQPPATTPELDPSSTPSESVAESVPTEPEIASAAPEIVSPAEPVPEGRSVIRAPRGRTPEPQDVPLDVPEPEPQRPVTGVIAPPAPAPIDPELDRWRRMRALGDNLFEERNRDAGLLALTHAADAGFTYARKPGADVSVQLEVARLGYRLGALQQQFASSAEARATLEASRKILQRIKPAGDDAKERADLLDNITFVLAGLRKD